MSKKIRLVVALLMMFTCALVCGNKAEAQTSGWKNGYFYIDGKKQTSRWITEGKNRYFLDKKGKKLTGWHRVGGAYYFFNAKGNNYKAKKKIGAQVTKLSDDVVTMGIDASEFQGSVDWNAVKASGVNFAMIRVGYGAGRYGNRSCKLDKRFREYVEEASEAGIQIGIYLYSYAVTPKQALAEAEFVIEQLDGVPVSFPVAFDIEDDYIIQHTTKEERTANARTFMDTIAAAGYYPMYYCNQNWYNNYLDTKALEDYDFWYARYTHEEPDGNQFPFTMWQSTSTQKMNGITENTVDVDFLYEDYFSEIDTRRQAAKYGWRTEGTRKYYYFCGERKTDGWFTMAGETFYLTKYGTAVGWITMDGKQYYFNNNGVMQTGFVKIGGKRYLFGDDGSLQYDTVEPGVTIDKDGVCRIKKGWYKDKNGKYFYRKSSGKLAKNEWIKTGGKKYYADANSRRTVGMKTIKGSTYYFDKDTGAMKKGWLTYKGRRYYFKSNGKMVKKSTIKIKGKKYTFDKKGRLS